MTPDSEGLKALFGEKFIEKLVDGFVQYRMTVVWCDLIHRFQHKITVLHVDMRNVKIRSICVSFFFGADWKKSNID